MTSQLGRPVRLVDAVNRNDEIEKLLVEGELINDGEGKQVRVYPTSSEVAERLHVSKSWVSKYAKANRCFERRNLLQAKVRAKAQEQLVKEDGKRLAYDTERALQLCDKVLSRYDELVGERGINNFAAADLDKMVRLRRYLQGDADSRQEVTSTLTLDTLQGAHREFLRHLNSATEAECGIEAGEGDEKALAAPIEEANARSKS